MSAEPTLLVSQPELPTLEAWLIDMFPGADLDKLEIPGRVVVEIAKSYAATQSAERDRELQQAREEIARLKEALTKADFFLSHSGNQRAIVGNSFEKPSGAMGAVPRYQEICSRGPASRTREAQKLNSYYSMQHNCWGKQTGSRPTIREKRWLE